MPFVFKGEAIRLGAFFVEGFGTRLYEGQSVLRVLSETRFLDIPEASGNVSGLTAVDLTEGATVDFEQVFISSAQLLGETDVTLELILQEGIGAEVDGYRIAISGPSFDLPAPGADVEELLGQIDTDTATTLADPMFDLRQAESFQFLGETGTRLLTGTDAEREARAESIAYLYEAGLDRDGNIDEGGLNFWIDTAGNGFSQRQIAQAFLDSAEFEAAFGAPETLTDEQYVEQLYQNVLDRASDQAGFDFWFGALESVGGQRDVLLIAFARSNENITGSPDVATLTETEPGIWEFIA